MYTVKQGFRTEFVENPVLEIADSQRIHLLRKLKPRDPTLSYDREQRSRCFTLCAGYKNHFYSKLMDEVFSQADHKKTIHN